MNVEKRLAVDRRGFLLAATASAVSGSMSLAAPPRKISVTTHTYKTVKRLPIKLDLHRPDTDKKPRLAVWIHGGNLREAIPYELQISQSGRADGLCAAPPAPGSEALHRLAYWTAGSTTLLVGEINESDGELAWSSVEDIETGQLIGACTFTFDGIEVYGDSIAESSNLRHRGRETLLTLSEAGGLSVLFGDGEEQTFDITPGITVRVPDMFTSLAATGDPRGGGYPDGLIILGGTIGNSDHRAILVDPKRITASSIPIPPGGR